MALTEDQILVSFEVNVSSSTVSILWNDRILRDGEVISSTPHRGVYELLEGDLPEHIRDHLGASMAQFADEAILAFSQSNAALLQRVNELETLVTARADETNNLQSLLFEKIQAIDFLQKKLGALDAGTQ